MKSRSRTPIMRAIVCATMLLTTAHVSSLAADLTVPIDSGKVELMADSTSPVILPGIVVTSDRTPLPLISVTGAAYVVPIKQEQMAIRPTLTSVISSIPGVRAVANGNPWGQANLDVRGFYGAGQSQYLRTTYAGIPLNDISSGLVDLSDFSMLESERLEAVNGPGSSQFGDFGFGGTLALQPARSVKDGNNRLSLTLGSNKGFNGGIRLGGKAGKWDHQAIGSFKSNDGWREHSALKTQRVAVMFGRHDGGSIGLDGVFSFGHTREEIPGALTQEQLDVDRTAYGFDPAGSSWKDLRDRDRFLLGVSSSVQLSPTLELKPVVYGKYEGFDDIVTLTNPLNHSGELFSGGADISLTMVDTIADRPLTLTAGISGEYGTISTTYGTSGSSGTTSYAITDGTGMRKVAAGYLTGLYYVTPQLYVIPGVRVDYVRTKFTPEDALITRSKDSTGQYETVTSPKFAVGADLTSQITMYASVAGAFKAPTLVMLYDSPPPYLPFPPFFGYTTISNGKLESMRGTNFEVGFRVADRKTFYASLNYFWYKIKNEIEFDLPSMRYKNLGRSRHYGSELGISVAPSNQFKADLAYSYNSAVSDGGDYKGNQLNGVPQFSYDLALTYSPFERWQVLGQVSGISKQFLTLENKENETSQKELGDYTIFALGANFMMDRITVSAGVQNLFDKEYNADGHFDPTRGDEFPFPQGRYMYYPAPGRTFTVTVSSAF